MNQNIFRPRKVQAQRADAEKTIYLAPDIVSNFLKEAGLCPSPEKNMVHGIFKGRGESSCGTALLRPEGIQGGRALHSRGERPLVRRNDRLIERIRSIWNNGLAIARRLVTRAGGLEEGLPRTVVQATMVFKISCGLRFYGLNAAQPAKLKTRTNDARVSQGVHV